LSNGLQKYAFSFKQQSLFTKISQTGFTNLSKPLFQTYQLKQYGKSLVKIVLKSEFSEHN